jgi:hypothetical protein
MCKLTVTLAVLAALAGGSVALAAESSATGTASTSAAFKGAANVTSGTGGIARQPNTGAPSVGTHPPPSAGCGTLAGGMKQGC